MMRISPVMAGTVRNNIRFSALRTEEDVKRREKAILKDPSVLLKLPRVTLSDTDNRNLIARSKQGDEAAKQQLLEAHIPLVMYAVQRHIKQGNYVPPDMLFEDLVQHGIIALEKAIML